MPRIEGELQVAGIAGHVWVEIKDTEGRCFVLGEPGEIVDVLVVKNVRRAVCPTCEGRRISFYTPPASIVPTRADRCSRCGGRGFIPVTELTRDEAGVAVLNGTVSVSRR